MKFAININYMPKTIIILVASGLVGKKVLDLALENEEIEQITILVRKSLFLNHPKLIEVITGLNSSSPTKSLIKLLNFLS